jgi:hypothetical protein
MKMKNVNQSVGSTTLPGPRLKVVPATELIYSIRAIKSTRALQVGHANAAGP